MNSYRLSNVSDSSVFISVIICTHRRPDSLPHTLKSLTLQTWSGGNWEVIVVENDSEPSSAVSDILTSFMPRLPLRHYIENVPNLSRARNLGARIANGEYLAYIDDDAEASEVWLEALMNGLKEFRPDFCGGPSYPLFRNPKPGWFREEYAIEYVYGEEPRALKYAEWIGGMNFIVRREVVLSFGGFREDLGMAGGKIAYGEETCLLMDAWKINRRLKIMYLPTVSVHHEVRPVKMTLKWNVRSWWAGGRDCASMNLYGNLVQPNIKRLLFNSIHILINTLALLPLLLIDSMKCNFNRCKRHIFDSMKSDIFWVSYGVNSLVAFYAKAIQRQQAKR